MAQVNILQGFTQADSLKRGEAICGEDLSVQTVHQIPTEKGGVHQYVLVLRSLAPHWLLEWATLSVVAPLSLSDCWAIKSLDNSFLSHWVQCASLKIHVTVQELLCFNIKTPLDWKTLTTPRLLYSNFLKKQDYFRKKKKKKQ